MTETVAMYAKDIVAKGPFKGELARPFLNSPLTAREIMSAGKGTALHSMIKDRSPGFAVRSIECRLITCVLEVESPEGGLRPAKSFKAGEWRKYHVKPFSTAHGFEKDAIGASMASSFGGIPIAFGRSVSELLSLR